MDNNEMLFKALQKIREINLKKLYEEDEQKWLLELKDLYYFDPVLCEHLLQEANRNQREVKNIFINLVVHMLKWQYQSERQGNSWRLTIVNSANELEDILESSKTLFNYCKDNYIKWYKRILYNVSLQINKDINDFPQEFPYNIETFWKEDNIEKFLSDNAKENTWTKFNYKKRKNKK